MPDDDDMTQDEARDLGLLDELRGIATRLDPVPPAALLAARSAIAWRTMDAELAELTYDSLVDDERAAVRNADAARLVTFEVGDVQIEIQVASVGEHRRLVGQIVPTAAGSLELRSPEARVEAAVDELGRFSFERAPAGPVQLRFAAAGDAPPVQTDWLIL